MFYVRLREHQENLRGEPLTFFSKYIVEVNIYLINYESKLWCFSDLMLSFIVLSSVNLEKKFIVVFFVAGFTNNIN